MTPLPPEFVETSATPSPSRGEGKNGTAYTTGDLPPSTLIAVPVM